MHWVTQQNRLSTWGRSMNCHYEAFNETIHLNGYWAYLTRGRIKELEWLEVGYQKPPFVRRVGIFPRQPFPRARSVDLRPNTWIFVRWENKTLYDLVSPRTWAKHGVVNTCNNKMTAIERWPKSCRVKLQWKWLEPGGCDSGWRVHDADAWLVGQSQSLRPDVTEGKTGAHQLWAVFLCFMDNYTKQVSVILISHDS